jgi:hypothetical protein
MVGKMHESALEQVYRAEGNIYHPLHDVITRKPAIENCSLLPIDYNNNKVIIKFDYSPKIEEE